MAHRPSVECPICHADLSPSNELRPHLVEDHTKGELAKHIVGQWEESELGDGVE